MGVLNKNELMALAGEGKIFYNDNYEKENFKSASYDLRIGTIYKNGEIYSEDHPNDKISHIEIKPSEIVTMLTFEEIKIPCNCVGTVFPINKMSSRGLLILNPGHIDPGFVGPITICAINLSNESFKIALKDSIFTLIMSELKTPLNEDESYNPSFPKKTRKQYEKEYNKNNFSKLSNSIFDLVINYKEAKELLVKLIYNRFIRSFKGFIAMLISAAGLLGGIYLLIPNSFLFNNQSNKIENVYYKNIDSIIEVKDSIINAKNTEIDNLKNLKANEKD